MMDWVSVHDVLNRPDYKEPVLLLYTDDSIHSDEYMGDYLGAWNNVGDHRVKAWIRLSVLPTYKKENHD